MDWRGNFGTIKNFSKSIIGKKNRASLVDLSQRYIEKGLPDALEISHYSVFEKVSFAAIYKILTFFAMSLLLCIIAHEL